MKKIYLPILAIMAAQSFSFGQINTFPYAEDFEGGAAGWTLNDVGGNSSWELATPAGAEINSAASGLNAWVVNATGEYNANENASIVSPEFDLSTLTIPVVELSVWWSTEFSWDGAVIQSSIDNQATWQNIGAQGDPNNWFNDNSINAGPGGSQDGWTGDNGNGSNGWLSALNVTAGLAGQASVYFRVVFASDGSVQREGFAFDDFSVREATHDIFVLGTNNLTTVETCTQDGIPDITSADNIYFGSEPNYTYIITDAAGTILAFPPANSGDTDPAPPGNCRIYGAAYSGLLDSMLVGSDVNTAVLSDMTFDLSDTWIQVNRYENNVEAGMVSEAITGDTLIHTCTQDGIDDIIDFATTSTSSANYTYIVTDKFNQILAIANGSQNFDGAPADTCRVWGVSYNGTLDSTVIGSDVNAAVYSSACYEVSTNWIDVARLDDNSGASTVSLTSGATVANVCVGDGAADVLEATHLTASTANYAYVVTDGSGTILAFPPSNMTEFDGAPAGVCRIYGVSYNGEIDTMALGSNIMSASLSDACFTLSANWIDVNRTDVDGGTIAESGAADTVFVALDGTPDVVTFSTTSASSSNYAYVFTTDANVILGFNTSGMNDFNGAPAGTCYAYGLSYSGSLDALAIGEDVMTASLSTDCYELSSNWIVIVRTESTANISELNAIDFTIFPVPATENITISGLENDTYTVTITNMVGATVLNNANFINNGTLNVADLNAGVYFVNLMDSEGNTSTKRVLKK